MGPKQPPSSERPVQHPLEQLIGASGDVPAGDAPASGAGSAPGDTVTVEAATAEKALEELTGIVGPDAEILRADKVQRGGIGGFFAREVVQLTARRRPGGAQGPEGPAAPGAPGALGGPGAFPLPAATTITPAAANGATDPFAEALGRFLSEDAGAEKPGTDAAARPSIPATQVPAQPVAHAAPASVDESRSLRSAAVPGPGAGSSGNVRPFIPPAVVLDVPAVPSIAPVAVASSVPVEPPALPAAGSPSLHTGAVPGAASPSPASEMRSSGPPETTARGTGTPDWSPEELLRLGLPVSLVRPMIDHPPTTDAAWVEALSMAVAHLCGPLASLSDEAQLLIGPRAHLLAEPLQLPQADYPDTPPVGSAVVSLHVPTADLGLVLRLLGDRRLHLVAGGESWERLRALRPSAVSWVGAEALPGALALCASGASGGLTLGYGRSAGTGGSVASTAAAFRATPLEVALGIRSLLGRR